MACAPLLTLVLYYKATLKHTITHSFAEGQPSKREIYGRNTKAIITMAFNDGVPKGIRTPVTAVKGRCPRPLDDGDKTSFVIIWWS